MVCATRKVSVMNRIALLTSWILACSSVFAGPANFRVAVPVWPQGLERTMNANVRFVSKFTSSAEGRAVLRVTGSSFYRIRLNDEHVGYGPARGPKDFFRVDEWPLDLLGGSNSLEIDATVYNCNTYYTAMHSGFLQAEVVTEDGRILSATGRGDDFSATDTERVERVPRYSYQRGFTEVYHFDGKPRRNLLLGECPRVKLLPRRVSYPKFELNESLRLVARGEMVLTNAPCKDLEFLCPTERRPDRRWYLKDEFSRSAVFDVTGRVFSAGTSVDGEGFPVRLAENGAVLLDAGINDCGFFGATVVVHHPGRLVLVFDEVLVDGRVDPWRMDCANAVEWIFENPGTYAIETMEPYVWRYANLYVCGGADLTVSRAFVRTYKNPDTGRAKFRCSDHDIERIFEAAKETFAQNAVDGFTDCPSRERAGWLCDSFFMGRVARFLTGNVESERLFLENYLLPESFENLPAGMVPMCYPSDHPNGEFIPNWALWLILEVEEFLSRSGDRSFVDAMRPRLEGIVAYLDNFSDENGLLRELRSWVFIEWSAANKLTQDLNYPSNMLWAEALDAMDRLYGRPDLAAKARKARESIRQQSWTGSWFCDNACFEPNGSLKTTGFCTETCQYYAYYFKTVTPEAQSGLWNVLLKEFGPNRRLTHKYAEIWPSNAFIGNYLRLELLSRTGQIRQLLDEMKGYFLYMAERTGTLWEHNGTQASCDHGFASHVVVALYRDILGVRMIDYEKKTISVNPPLGLALTWCEGEIPVSDKDLANVSWVLGQNGHPEVTVKLPVGWSVCKCARDTAAVASFKPRLRRVSEMMVSCGR